MNAWKVMGEAYLVSAIVAFVVAIVIEILVRCVQKLGKEETVSVQPAAVSDDDAAIAVAIAAAKRASGK